MNSSVKKNIAQKKKKGKSKRTRTKTQRMLLRTRNRSRITKEEQDFARICCRCELRIGDKEHALGGGYDGVVCLNHRSCMSCWFDTAARGARKHESAKTKPIGLVNKPFKGTVPLCPGCRKGLPPFFEMKTRTTARQYTVDDDGVVNIIEDSDDSD
jgi:hypothetical protein